MESLSSIKSQSWLVWFMRGFLLLVFLILFARLFELQIIRGDYFRGLSEGNRIRRIAITAPRGNILARGGEVLVGNKELKTSANEDGVNIKDEANDEIEIPKTIREYKLGSAIGHISGYVGEVNKDELGKVKGQCTDKGPRKLGNYVGRTGLESVYECLLSGENGEELVEVNASGKKIRSLGQKDPVNGTDLKTTIDAGLQTKIAQLMSDRKGSVVISDGNGQILALFSGPSYDPNIFVDPEKRGDVASVMTDKDHLLFNRAIGGLFHPGSIYKPIVAAAALEDGKIDKNYYFNDTGAIVIKNIYGTYSYKNWYFTQYGGTEGNINLVRALARSTDTFFYKVGELIGVESLHNWSEKFGLNTKTGIDLPGEVEGLVPNEAWKLDVKKERWFLGDTYNMSIGQGDLALTPIEMNAGISVIANGGRLCKTHLKQAGEECKDLGLKKDTIDLIKEGMKAACASGGTAFTFFDFKEKSGKDVLCKTGTAQDEKGEPHAWFTAFAPADNPEIVITVLAENGGEGSKVAGPIAREIFNYWFKVPSAPTPSVIPASE